MTYYTHIHITISHDIYYIKKVREMGGPRQRVSFIYLKAAINRRRKK